MSTAARPRVVVVPTARPTFVVDVARERAAEARALLTELGADVTGPEELVMTPEDLEAAAALPLAEADLVVNVCASFSDASPALRLYSDLDKPVLLWSFREPGPVGDRLWLNSMCGANLFGHALVVHAGRTPHLVHGDPGEPGVREALRRALEGNLPAVPALPTEQQERAESEPVQAAMATLQGRRLGLVGEAPPGFTPSHYDGALLSKLLGIEVEQISVDDMFGKVAGVPDSERDTEHESALAAQPSLAAVDREQAQRSACVTSAMRSWRDNADLSGMAIRCWPEFPTSLGVCPCSSLSRLADAGTPTACERDVYGAVTMMLLEALGSGTTYLVDTVDLDSEANLVRLWHCGSAATSLAAVPADATQSVHCNRKIGVAGNFPLKTGPVVMARLTEDPGTSGLRLLIASGESVPEPNRFQGNTAAVRLDTDATAFVQSLVTGGFPHHTVLAWTDVRPALRTAADQLGIPVVEFAAPARPATTTDTVVDTSRE
jgi:L-fucose isomerase-like protein